MSLLDDWLQMAMDFNHVLAGQDLKVDVELISLRKVCPLSNQPGIRSGKAISQPLSVSTRPKIEPKPEV